jgi:hypothetical protein
LFEHQRRRSAAPQDGKFLCSLSLSLVLMQKREEKKSLFIEKKNGTVFPDIRNKKIFHFFRSFLALIVEIFFAYKLFTILLFAVVHQESFLLPRHIFSILKIALLTLQLSTTELNEEEKLNFTFSIFCSFTDS